MLTEVKRITTYIFLFVFVFSCKQEIEQTKENQIIKARESKEAIQIRWLGHWYGEGKKEVMVREIAREFSLLNQDIDIKLEFPHQVYTYNDESELFPISYQEIAKMIQKNEWPWDIMLCDQERYKRAGDLIKDPEWGKKYLVDFSNEPWIKNTHIDGLLDNGDLAKKYGGIIPGPFLEGISYILYVSEPVEKLLGIKVKRLDMQLSDFVSYAQAVYNYNQTHSEKITCFSLQFDLAVTSLFSQLIQSEYGKEDFENNKESLAALKTVYESLEKLSAYKPIEQYTTYPGMKYDAAQRVLKQEKYLFCIQPSWMYLLWNNSNPKGAKLMKPCEIPSMDGKVSPTYPGMYQAIFVVPKNSKHVEEAKKLIKFISTAETSEKWMKYSKCPTGLKSQISYSDFGQEEFELYFRHLQRKYGHHIVEANLSNLLFRKNSINFNVEKVLEGKMTAAEALKAVERQVY